MKDGLDPLSSGSAAYLNAYETSHDLHDHAAIPQKVAESLKWISEFFGGLVIPHASSPAKLLFTRFVGTVAGLAAQQEELNLETFAYHVARDFERLDKAMNELQKNHRTVNLLVQGAMEARSAASKERVERLAAVVVSGLLNPDHSEDMILEFLRFTSLLAESDVRVLYVTAKLQKPLGATTNDEGHWRHEVLVEWPQLLKDLVADGISQMSYRSAFVRLQGLGLMEPIDPGFGGGRPPYEVLELGRQYLSYLQNYHHGG